MHTEDDLLPISALQHMLFCERQTALIHLERLWVENRFTAEGRLLHKKTDNARSETRDGIRITRSLPVHSFELGIFGVCDVVTFKPPEFNSSPAITLAKRVEAELQRTRTQGVCISAMKSSPPPDGSSASIGPPPFHHWTITPVEYKRGQPKKNFSDRVQLCAQAICLEEMLNVRIDRGDLFYGKRQRRTEVSLDTDLRELTRTTAERLHRMIQARETPKAVRELKCEKCSLLPVCMPAESSRPSASRYLARIGLE
jgi:CRISPR-associated exonuclease Cas4